MYLQVDCIFSFVSLDIFASLVIRASIVSLASLVSHVKARGLGGLFTYSLVLLNLYLGDTMLVITKTGQEKCT